MIRKAARAVVAMTVGVTSLTVAPPAHAVGTAEIVFECHAYMSSPAVSGGTGECKNGIVAATAEVTATGTSHSGNLYVVTGVGPVRAAFIHVDTCIGNAPSLLMTAEGTATVTNVTGISNGTPVAAALELNFIATVVGSEVLIQVTGGNVSFSTGDTATVVAGVGAGTYVPLLRSDNFCPRSGPLEALVQGEVALTL